MRQIIVSLISIVMVVSSTMNGQAFPKEGLVLHLSFDQSTIQAKTAKDLSKEGNDAIINGGAKVVAGKFGDALEFDGKDDFVEVPLKPSITFSKGDSLTVQAWVKTDDKPPQNDGIVGNYRPATDALWVVSVSGDNAADRGKMGFSVRDKGRANSAGVRSADFLNDDKWHHLAGVRDQKEKKIRFYVDGTLIGEQTDNTQDINSGQSIWIGEHLNRYYKGLIDDVKVWNRPLSADELDLSRSGATGVDASSKLATSWGLVKSRY